MEQIRVELQEFLGNDESIARSAWTSSYEEPQKDLKTEKDVERVVNMLADSKHSVPFESVVLRFWMRLPIAIDRQVMTHRIQCLTGDNELYFDLPLGSKVKNKRYQSKIHKIKLSEFVSKWENGVKSKTKFGANCNKKHKNRLSKMKLRSVDEVSKEIIHTNVTNVFKKGEQPVYRISFENGYTIESTLNHQYFTESGWMNLSEALGLDINLEQTPNIFDSQRLFYVNGLEKYSRKFIAKKVKVIKIEYLGYKETYDIEVSGPYHNFICNGIVVHNSASGLSGRYRTMPNDYYKVSDDIKSILSKTGREKYYTNLYDEACDSTNKFYQSFVIEMREDEKLGRISNKEFKRLREFFRGVLPQHNMTERTSIFNLRSFANFYKLRSKSDAQPEIQKIANLMLEAVKEKNICPVAISALERNLWAI